MSKSRLAALKLNRDRALDGAALLGALAASHVPEASDQQLIRERLHAQIVAHLHDFAFASRRYIEQASRLGVDMRAMAEKKGVFAIRAIGGEEVDEQELYKPFLWVVGRIIHSDTLEIEDRQTVAPETDKSDVASLPWGFHVRSDRDDENETWFIFLEFFIDRFLQIDRNFESDVLALLRTNPVASA